jgi:site-specific recombinase
MRLPHAQAQCPKCDDQLDRQSTGVVLKVDIAHQGERVHEALAKLSHWCGVADQERAAGLRLIVGSGLIREAILAELPGRSRITPKMGRIRARLSSVCADKPFGLPNCR